MRDSFGGVFTMNLLLVFIFIFVAFSAVSLTYAKAFRIKNKVIDFVEQNAITDISGNNLESKLEELDAILKSSNYNITCNEISETEGYDEAENEYCYNGVVIRELSKDKIEGTNSQSMKYEIRTYAIWNLGTLNKILVLGGKQENSEGRIVGSWSIKGEAKVIMNN